MKQSVALVLRSCFLSLSRRQAQAASISPLFEPPPPQEDHRATIAGGQHATVPSWLLFSTRVARAQRECRATVRKRTVADLPSRLRRAQPRLKPGRTSDRRPAARWSSVA